jgi:hypothetical protein
MTMLLSGEIRWFWKTRYPAGILEWFIDEDIHGCKPGGGPPGRNDVYLVGNDQGEIGIKTRGATGGKGDGRSAPSDCRDVEIKGLAAVDWDALNLKFLSGPVEYWCKWPFRCLNMTGTEKCELQKVRWLRKFDTGGAYPAEIPLGPDERPLDGSIKNFLPVLGCNVEMTEIRVSKSEKWFSFCFEAFGDRGTIADDLRAVATALNNRGSFPDLQSGLCLSYPRWISIYVARSQTK